MGEGEICFKKKKIAVGMFSKAIFKLIIWLLRKELPYLKLCIIDIV